MTLSDRLPDVSPNAAAGVRQRVADNLSLVVMALLVLAVVGGWVSYAAHVNPPTEPTERTIGSVETGGEYEHGAVVRSENPVYPVDSTLQDRRHYFHSVSPVLNGTFAHEYDSNGSGVIVETTLTLRIRSVDSEGEYWSEKEPLADRRVEGTDADGPVTVPFEVNVTEATHRIAQTENQLGGSPGDPELAIVAETAVGATVDGERVTTTRTHELPIIPSGSTYTVGPAESGTASEQVTRTVAVPREYGPVASYGSVVLFLGAVVLLGFVVRLHLTASLRPSGSVQEMVSTARERTALDEWITTGRVPPTYRNGPFVSVTSLSGLVDVAIDCDRRVIEDRERGGFYVVDGDVVYVFEPGEGSADPLAPAGNDKSSGNGDGEFDWLESSDGTDTEFEWAESAANTKEET